MLTAPEQALQARLNEALELAEEGKHPAALSILRGLAADCTDPRVFVAYGMSLQALGHSKEAVRQFERALSLKPHYCEGDLRLFLADSLLKSGRKADAVVQWRIAAAMKPEYPSYEAVQNEAKLRLAEHEA
jgi:Flp pilus assembly protein TadD